MKILILTSCTGKKSVHSDMQLKKEDFLFMSDAEKFQERMEPLNDLKMEAEEIYSGEQHKRLLRGVKQFREKYGGESIDLRILSAGFGIISGNKQIVPYECSFNEMNSRELTEWSRFLKIPDMGKEILIKKYDLIIVLLGEKYLRALSLEEGLIFNSPVLFLTGKASERYIQGEGNISKVIVSNNEAKRFSCGLVGLKGELASRILMGFVRKGSEFGKRLLNSGDKFYNILEDMELPWKHNKINYNKDTSDSPKKFDYIIKLSDQWENNLKNGKFSYFIPDWDDLVDPEYDFITDTHSGGRGTWANQAYAHQLYSIPNYDGLLVSKIVAEATMTKTERINQLGVHRYLRVPRNFPIMGDCGAFGYVGEETPPYKTEEILEYYTCLDFDYGVSIDHIVNAAPEDRKKYRYELTINNAEDFIKKHKEMGLTWEPIGAVQGWDPGSYARAACKYVEMGYKYIGLGGLVRAKTQQILNILQEVKKVTPTEVKIHLFGIGRLNAINEFMKYGVTSIDSASSLRKAWLGSKLNYLTMNGWYPAIRIPQSNGSFRAKQLVKSGTISMEDLMKLEEACLSEIREFAGSHGSPKKSLIDHLVEYDILIAGERSDTRDKIIRTLEDRPWDHCDCSVCRNAGVEVTIFRGNNRNRRRGFHNTYTFYRLLQMIISGEEIPWLSKEKKKTTNILPNQ